MDTSIKYILCRLCLSESDTLMDIFDENRERGFVISEVIEDLLHFKVMRLRGLPWLVCSRCLEKLKEFHLFKIQCIDSKVAFESRFLMEGKHAINDQIEIRRVRKEDLQPDLGRQLYVSQENERIDEDFSAVLSDSVCSNENSKDIVGSVVEISRLKMDKLEQEIDQEFYPQVILETVDEGEDGDHILNTVLPEVCNTRHKDMSSISLYHKADIASLQRPGLMRGLAVDKHYHCSSCGKSFVKSSHLTRHMRTHTNDRPYACELCGKRYIENSDLTSHMMSHTGEKPFSCPHCGKGFYRNSHLNRHINTHRTTKARAQAVLLDAAEILAGGAAIKREVSLDDDDVLSAVSEGIERYDARSLHFMGGLLAERVLPGAYSLSSKLDQQRLSWLRDDGRLLHTNCGRVEVKQEPIEMPLHEQAQCRMVEGSGDQGIMGGGLQDDEDSKGFLCSFCGKGFGKNSQLLRHMRTHTDDRPFVCETCGRRYIEASDLNQHIKVHSGIKPHRCGQCGKGFMKNSHLKRHHITHTSERPYSCKVCRKGFIESSDLNRHMVVHSKEQGGDGRTGRDFGCNLCGKAFSFKSNLVTHMRTHSGSKPFVCEHCGKGFAQNGNLITHRRIHTGERPFVCRLCNKGFSQKSTLNHHLKTH